MDFDSERPRLVGIATRIVGSAADAEDVVQEAWLRLSQASDIDNPAAWLTTVVTRLCLDQLRARRTRQDREQAASISIEPADPEADVALADRVGEALTLVLDQLAPAERAAFVLHDVFGYPFPEIGAILGRSSAAARQLASRARRRVQGLPESPTERAQRVAHKRVVEAFLSAARGGDMETLLGLLAPDAVMRADGAGQLMGAQAEYVGRDAVAGRFHGSKGAAPILIDGELGAAWRWKGTVMSAFVFHIDDGCIREVELIADADVLGRLEFRTRSNGVLVRD